MSTIGKELRKVKKELRRELPKSWNVNIDKTVSNLKKGRQSLRERSELGRERLFGKRRKKK